MQDTTYPLDNKKLNILNNALQRKRSTKPLKRKGSRHKNEASEMNQEINQLENKPNPNESLFGTEILIIDDLSPIASEIESKAKHCLAQISKTFHSGISHIIFPHSISNPGHLFKAFYPIISYHSPRIKLLPILDNNVNYGSSILLCFYWPVDSIYQEVFIVSQFWVQDCYLKGYRPPESSYISTIFCSLFSQTLRKAMYLAMKNNEVEKIEPGQEACLFTTPQDTLSEAVFNPSDPSLVPNCKKYEFSSTTLDLKNKNENVPDAESSKNTPIEVHQDTKKEENSAIFISPLVEPNFINKSKPPSTGDDTQQKEDTKIEDKYSVEFPCLESHQSSTHSNFQMVKSELNMNNVNEKLIERPCEYEVSMNSTLIPERIYPEQDISFIEIERNRPESEIEIPKIGQWVETKSNHEESQIFKAKVLASWQTEGTWMFRLKSPDIASTYIEPLKNVRIENIWSNYLLLDLGRGRKSRRSSKSTCPDSGAQQRCYRTSDNSYNEFKRQRIDGETFDEHYPHSKPQDEDIDTMKVHESHSSRYEYTQAENTLFLHTTENTPYDSHRDLNQYFEAPSHLEDSLSSYNLGDNVKSEDTLGEFSVNELEKTNFKPMNFSLDDLKSAQPAPLNLQRYDIKKNNKIASINKSRETSENDRNSINLSQGKHDELEDAPTCISHALDCIKELNKSDRVTSGDQVEWKSGYQESSEPGSVTKLVNVPTDPNSLSSPSKQFLLGIEILPCEKEVPLKGKLNSRLKSSQFRVLILEDVLKFDKSQTLKKIWEYTQEDLPSPFNLRINNCLADHYNKYSAIS